MMRTLRHVNETVVFVDILSDTTAKSGYGNLPIKCCPQCGTLTFRTQCCCLHCGMIATYQGSGAEITFSTDTVFESSSVAAPPAAGSAQRSSDVAPVTPLRTIADEDIEDDINNSWSSTAVWRFTIVVDAGIYGKYDMEKHKSQARLA